MVFYERGNYMRYHNITKDDMLNGDGLRVVLWVAGCSHCCKECQNPVTWDPDGGVPFDENARQEIFDQLDKPYISGITFSGGDPFHSANRPEVRSFMAEIREKYPDKAIWLYTGDVWENVRNDAAMQYIDVLVDGEFVVEEKDTTLRWKGSRNQRVIDVQESLKQEEAAKELEISVRSYCRYEYGEREPVASVLWRMADFYGVTIDFLVGRTDNPV